MNSPRPGPAAALAAALAAGALAALSPAHARAQTDFYNLDKDRPLRVEDAYATKRYAFELQAAPLTLSQDRDGTLRYRPALELKHGLLPGLDVATGVKLGWDRPAAAEARRTDAELELSSLLNLTVETRWLPALGVRLTGHVPLEGGGSSALELRGLATRGIGGPVRAHLNAGWTPGDAATERWWAGLALDYVLPFRHLLLLAETWIGEHEPDDDAAAERRVHSTAGLRYQLSPTLAMDAGVGRTWTGAPGPDWQLTFGLTREFAVRALMPGLRR
jgi:hypothetical protein